MDTKGNKKILYFGVALIFSGIVFNKWVIEMIIVPDRSLDSFLPVIMITTFEIVAIILGAVFVIKRPAIRVPSKRKIALLCISVFFICMILEAGARTWLNFIATPEERQKYVLYSEMAPSEFQWAKHHYLNYYPTPNYKLGATSHNSFGFRGREFSVQKPEGVYRIAVLGGSSVYSIQIGDDDKTFTAQMEKILRSRYGYKSVEVINAGVSGYNSWESLINLEFRVLDIDPDLVIVYQGSDDVHARLVSPSSYRGDNSGRRRPWELPMTRYFEHSCFLRILSRLFAYTIPVNVNFFVMAPTYEGACSSGYDQNESDNISRELLKRNRPVYFQRNLLNMTAIAKINNIDILFATWAYSPYFEDYASTPHYQDGFTEINDTLKDVAESRNVPLFDFAQAMPKDKRYWADGRHVNEEGALLKAELFAEFLHESGLISQ